MFRHAGLEEPAPYLIRGHPVFSTGLPLELIQMKIGAGMTILAEGVIYKQALANRTSPVHAKGMARDKIRSSARKENHRPHKVGREAEPAHGDR